MTRTNDEDDFVEFAAVSHERLRRTAYSLCGDWHRAFDITQEALMRLYVARPPIEHMGGMAAYARRAVRSVAIDHARKRSNTEVPALVVDTVPASPDVACAVADRETVMRALARLPQGRRACVVLRYFEDLSVADVAALLDVDPGTVKSQTSRGLASLRAILEEEAEELVPTSAGSKCQNLAGPPQCRGLARD